MTAEREPIVSRRRELTQQQGQMELYASARQCDAVAAQLELLSSDDCLTDQEADELASLGREVRRVASSLFERAGHV